MAVAGTQKDISAVRSDAALAGQAERAAAAATRTARTQRGLRKARAQLLDRWRAHQHAGTAETHEANSQHRAGAIARLHATGYLNDDEMAWADEIAATAERIAADVTVRAASYAVRIDSSRHGDAFYEALGAVWDEMTYSRWRRAIGSSAALILDIIVRDTGIARAAAAHGMHVRRARRLLTDALGEWSRIHRSVRNEVGPAEVAAAQAGIL